MAVGIGDRGPVTSRELDRIGALRRNYQPALRVVVMPRYASADSRALVIMIDTAYMAHMPARCQIPENHVVPEQEEEFFKNRVAWRSYNPSEFVFPNLR